MRTTIALSSGTRDRILDLKRPLKLRSAEAVIVKLLDGMPMGAKALYLPRKQQVDKVLDKHKVRHVVAFGSRARGDARLDSDLDLVGKLPKGATLLNLVHIQDDLTDAFGVQVHFISAGGVREGLKEELDRDGVLLVGNARLAVQEGPPTPRRQ